NLIDGSFHLSKYIQYNIGTWGANLCFNFLDLKGGYLAKGKGAYMHLSQNNWTLIKLNC
ncbi:hypothetical protein ACJX0J_013583, partial [Zea mays]